MIKLILLVIIISGVVVSIGCVIMSRYYAKKAARYRKKVEWHR